MYTDPYGLWEWPSLPQGFVDASAGFGDALSFGITGWARGKLDIGSVNECSGSYHGGQAAGIVAGFIDGEGEADIAFQTAHYADRLAAAGLDATEVEATVAGEVNATLSIGNRRDGRRVVLRENFDRRHAGRISCLSTPKWERQRRHHFPSWTLTCVP